MTTINAHFTGQPSNLEMFNFSGIKFPSSTACRNGNLIVSWTLETEDYNQALEEVHNSIDLDQAELWSCDLITLN